MAGRWVVANWFWFRAVSVALTIGLGMIKYYGPDDIRSDGEGIFVSNLSEIIIV